jgi:hypothetical protein
VPRASVSVRLRVPAARATFEPRPSLSMPAHLRTLIDHRSVSFSCQFSTSRKLDALFSRTDGAPRASLDSVQIRISAAQKHCAARLSGAAESIGAATRYRPRMTGSLKMDENGAAEFESIGIPKPSVVG